MGLQQLHKVVARPVEISENAKTKQNTGFDVSTGGGPAAYQNDTLDDDTPKGVLAGSVAALNNDSTYGSCDGSERPYGLFGINAAGENLESNRPKDHGKITLVSLGYHEVDVYETFQQSDMSTPLGYNAGDVLYCSPQGLLTNESGGPEVALVEEPPTSSSSSMVIKLLV